MVEVLEGLQVNPHAMLDNVERSKGLLFSEAVSLRLSRAVADRLVEQSVREKKHLLEVMLADAEASRVLTRDEMTALFDAEKSYGAAGEMTEQVLADWASARESGPLPRR
jgi:3-carboxy-cis,cis-muconate cycloisomerase